MKKRFDLIFLLIFLVITLITLILSLSLGALSLPFATAENIEASSTPKITVIIDAGHGGEDGGASSAGGLVEKDVNLHIASMLNDMLEMNGVSVIMTRTDDRLLYDRSSNYHGRKKKLDLAARLAVTSNVENAIFVSIHMNSFTDPKYSGLQVWYSDKVEGSKALAEAIQLKNRELLQPDNTRSVKSSTSAIYLLDNATVPSVLVECGFLSNPNEAERFEDESYRKRVAFVIFCAITKYIEGDLGQN